MIVAPKDILFTTLDFMFRFKNADCSCHCEITGLQHILQLAGFENGIRCH